MAAPGFFEEFRVWFEGFRVHRVYGVYGVLGFRARLIQGFLGFRVLGYRLCASGLGSTCRA